MVFLLLCCISLQLHEPAGHESRAVQRVGFRVQDAVQRHSTVGAPQNRRAGVELLHKRSNSLQFVRADEVCLVQEDGCRELDLLNEKAHEAPGLPADATLIFVNRLQAVHVVKEPRAVHHGHKSVQASHVAQHATRPSLPKRKSLRHRGRSCHTSALDDQVVELALACQLCHLLQQVLAQRAADAAALQRNHLRLAVRNVHRASLDGGGVHVHLAHVIHDNGNPHAFLVRKNVLRSRQPPEA